ncbi:MAG: hypothetical protein RIB98_09000 [Acidimicrobiales bacterium]
MADKYETLTAEELDAMTPDQRAKAFRDRIVTDPAEIPEEFRGRIFETAKRLGAERADQK